MKTNILLAPLNLSDDTRIFFTIMIVIILAALLFLIIRSIRKETNRWKSQIEGEGVLSVNQFKDNINNLILSGRKVNFTVLQINISDAKNLIKTLGELQYQNALSSLIRKLKLLMPGGTKVAQTSGDIIYILLKVKHTPASLDALFKMIFTESKKSIIVAGALKVEFDINIGAVSYPIDGKKLQELEENLALTVIAAQRQGLNKYAIYDIKLSNKESDEYKQYLEIKEAIDNKEFTVYYQPIVNLNTNEVDGAETLLRWKHREKGVLPPSSFLNIMEHTGDIYWVGLWALEQVFVQSVQWKKLYPEYSFKINTNLSLKQLINPMLIEDIRRLVKKHRVNPADFVMEINEATIFDSNQNVKSNIEKLSQTGFLVAVDNYRGEHSSFNNLAHIDIDIIKLSRKFVIESKKNKLVREIINMLIAFCKNNDKVIIVEGVEDLEFYEYIISLGINFGQGYYFSRPGNDKELMNAVVLTPWATVVSERQPNIPAAVPEKKKTEK